MTSQTPDSVALPDPSDLPGFTASQAARRRP